MLRRLYSRHSSHAALTTVTHCCTACPTIWCKRYNLYRTPLHVTPVLQKLQWLPIRQRVWSSSLQYVPGAPVVGWTNTDISNFQHSAYCWHWPHSASVCIWEDMCRSTHTQQPRWQKILCCRGPRVWNALPSYPRQNMNYKHFKRALKGPLKGHFRS